MFETNNALPNAEPKPHLLVLGTGGTIAGTASAAAGDANYNAAQLGVGDLLVNLPAWPGEAFPEVRSQQVAQMDSKDMSTAAWVDLTTAALQALDDPNVTGVVITHGTDTLEETATWLQLLLPPSLAASKPVVLTCAMRPATSAEADGPRNLSDALWLAQHGAGRGLGGVMAVCAGQVHAAWAVRKLHSHRLDAFSSGDAPLLANLHAAKLFFERNLPSVAGFIESVATRKEAIACLDGVRKAGLPWVEVLHSHADASPKLLHKLLADPQDRPHGLVVAATGNGTVHASLQAALLDAQAQGLMVWRSTRCVLGAVTGRSDDVLPFTPLPPAKARVAMQLQLLRQSIQQSLR